MYRKPVSPPVDRHVFSRTAAASRAVNLKPKPMRGGIRF